MQHCFNALSVVFGVTSSFLQGTDAQVYHFDAVPGPNNRSLFTLYLYFVYSESDAPKSDLGLPYVEFKNFEFHPEKNVVGPPIDSATYRGLQVSVLLWRDFWTVIDRRRFCSVPNDVEFGLVKHQDTLLVKKQAGDREEDMGVFIHTIAPAYPAVPPQGMFVGSQKHTLTRTGAYVLMLSNCGMLETMSVSGEATVRNPYGFLPAVEYYKMPFFAALFGAYMILLVVWIFLSVRWWSELSSIQHCITVVIVLGSAECLIWYLFLFSWNTTGVRGRVLFVIGTWLTVLKVCMSYLLVLVGSLGWGITQPYLDGNSTRKIQTLAFFYIIIDFMRESILAFKHSHALSWLLVAIAIAPVAFLNAGIFYWVFCSLGDLTKMLEQRGETEKLHVFTQFWYVLVCALVVAVVGIVMQMIDISSNGSNWKMQWCFDIGITHILYFVVLVAMMYLWAPHENSARYYYPQQLDGDDVEESNGKAGGVGRPEILADDVGHDVQDDTAASRDSNKMVGQKSGEATPDVIGARQPHGDHRSGKNAASQKDQQDVERTDLLRGAE